MKVYGGPVPNSDTKLTMSIADCIHSCGLPFRLEDHSNFQLMLTVAKLVGSSNKFPIRNQVATELLYVNYDTYVESTNKSLEQDIESFRTIFLWGRRMEQL